MTTNYHTPIPAGSPANASTFNNPLGQLDSAIKSLASLTKLNVSTDTTLTINSGAITITRSRHLIDTEGAAVSDDLTTINGGVEGDIVFLQTVSNSRVVLVKNTGNIYPGDGSEVRLDNTRKVLALMYDGTNWNEVGMNLALKLSAYNNMVVPDYQLGVAPALRARNQFNLRAAAATLQPSGFATPTINGTLAASNDTDSTYLQMTSGAVLGNIAGPVSATFNLLQTRHNPSFDVIIRTGASIANMRYWIGIFSAAPANTDTQTLHMAAFRYSTVVPDAGWIPVVAGGATNTAGSSMGAVAANTRYLLSIQVIDGGNTAVFRVNNGEPTLLTTNLPTNSQDLGFAVYAITNEAVAKAYKLSRMAIELD